MALFAVFVCLIAVSVVHSQSPTPDPVPKLLPNVDSSCGRPAKFVVIPGCVSSHWYQALSVIQELSKRRHKVQVSSKLSISPLAIALLCSSARMHPSLDMSAGVHLPSPQSFASICITMHVHQFQSLNFKA